MNEPPRPNDNFISSAAGPFWPGEFEPLSAPETAAPAAPPAQAEPALTVPAAGTIAAEPPAEPTAPAAGVMTEDSAPAEASAEPDAAPTEAPAAAPDDAPADPISTLLAPDAEKSAEDRGRSPELAHKLLKKRLRRQHVRRAAVTVCLAALLLMTGLVGALYLNSTGVIDLQRTDSALVNTLADHTLQLADRIRTALPGETYHSLKRISSDEEFVAAAHAARAQGYTSITLNLTPDYYAAANQHRLAILAGMQTYQAAYIEKACRYLYQDIVWSDRPVIACATETELQDAIRAMGQQGQTEFTLVFDKEFFTSLTALDWFSFRQLTGEAGLYAYSCCNYSSDAYYITVVGAEIETDVQLLNTVSQAFVYAETRAAEEASTIALYCSQEVYAQLTDTGGSAEGTGLSYISDLMVDCGILSGSWSMNGTSCVIRLKIDAYYPGFRCAHAWQKGDTSGLTEREKQLYDAALTMAQTMQTGDPFTTAMAIHDRLCATVGYYTDTDGENEDDTAAGALLNGWANCDGYTDAFYLVGTMAGLTVRYQHGNTYAGADESGSGENLTHAWNLLLLNGSWVHVDVTWDDRDDEYGWGHTWFAIGDDRMGRTHYWNRNDGMSTAAVTDLTTRPVNEYSVSSDSELELALSQAVAAGQSQITVFFENGMGVQVDRTFDLLHRLGRNVEMLYSVNERMGALTVYGIF